MSIPFGEIFKNPEYSVIKRTKYYKIVNKYRDENNPIEF